MKKLTLLLLLTIFATITINAQIVEEKLAYITVRNIKEGLLVCGIKEGNNPEFIAKLYDNDLNKIKYLNKSLGDGTVCKAISFCEIGDVLSVFFTFEIRQDFKSLTFSRDLKEISYESYIPDKYAELTTRYNPKASDDFYISGWENPLDHSFLKTYLGNEPFVFNDKFKSISRYEKIESQVGSIFYKAKWTTKLDVKKIQTTYSTMSMPYSTYYEHTSIFSIDENNVIATVTDKGDKKNFKTYLYVFDSKTGEIKFKNLIKFSDNFEIVFSEGYYDKENKTIVIAGDLFNVEKKGKEDENGADGLGVVLYNLKGEVIKSQKLETPKYPVKDLFYIPVLGKSRFLNFEKTHNGVLSIGKTKNGNYFFHCVNMPYENGSNFLRVGAFSKIEINSDLQLVNSKILMLDNDFLKESNQNGNSKDGCWYKGSSESGEALLYGLQYNDYTKILLINFDDVNQSAPKEVISKKNRYPADGSYGGSSMGAGNVIFDVFLIGNGNLITYEIKESGFTEFKLQKD